MGRKKIQPNELIGKTYDCLTIIGYDRYENENHFVITQCSCEAKTIEVRRLSDLKATRKKVCPNCRKKRRGKAERLSSIYGGMKSRCYNPNVPSFQTYGDRGIDICKQWLESKDDFIDWAINNGYEDGLTIDRINNDEGYNPENCRWITKSENSRLRNLATENKLKRPIECTSPNGVRTIVGKGLAKFCRENNLCSSTVHKVCKNKYSNHKGWKFKYVD